MYEFGTNVIQSVLKANVCDQMFGKNPTTTKQKGIKKYLLKIFPYFLSIISFSQFFDAP